MLRCLLPLFLAPLAAVAADKPNIILIYSDDHGWADLGVQGSDKDTRTPHLDAMARDGVRLEPLQSQPMLGAAVQAAAAQYVKAPGPNAPHQGRARGC